MIDDVKPLSDAELCEAMQQWECIAYHLIRWIHGEAELKRLAERPPRGPR